MIDQSLTPYAISFLVLATVAGLIALGVIVNLAAELRRAPQPVVPLDRRRPAVPTVSRTAA